METKPVYTLCQLQNIVQTQEGYIRWSNGFELDKEMKYSKDHHKNIVHPGISCVKINKEWSISEITLKFLQYLFITLKRNAPECHIYNGVYVGTDTDGESIIDDITYLNTLSNKLILTLVKIYVYKFYNRDDFIILKEDDIIWYDDICEEMKKQNIKPKPLYFVSNVH